MVQELELMSPELLASIEMKELAPAQRSRRREEAWSKRHSMKISLVTWL